MKNFLLKNNWFVSFKNFGLPFIFKMGIFKDIFLLILLYFWNCHFLLKTNKHFSIENQLVFASIIFLLKINTKISIELPVHFQPAILYWKRIQFFLLKINWVFSASFFYWKLEVIFLLILVYIWNCDFVLKINEKFSTENQLIWQLQKLKDFPLFFILVIFNDIFLLILLYGEGGLVTPYWIKITLDYRP